MKRIVKKGLISIVGMLLIMNFIAASVGETCYGEFHLADIFSGLIGVITWIPRAIVMAFLLGVSKLITAFASFGLEGIEGYGLGSALWFTEDSYITPFHIFFNKIALLDVNFLNFDNLTPGGTVETFRTAVAGWYYTIRLIAMMILAVILIYIGIRMAISTIASEKAMYKKMLGDWVTSLALLFLLHYIMLFTFACNDALVTAIETVCEDTNLDGIMLTLQTQAFGVEIVGAIASMIIFGIIIGQTISFLFAYVKRMITIGFLIMIAPLITVTYSIDKIGDQKAQALNTWLKEFVYNVLIQPFHCILFAAFVGVAFDLIDTTLFDDVNIAAMILAICCIQFIKTGEELVKKIFGFSQASSLTTMAAGAAMTMAAINKGGKAGQAIGSGVAKGQKWLASNKDKISKATGALTKKVDDARNKLSYVTTDAQGNKVLTERGKKKAAKQAGVSTKDKDFENSEEYKKASESVMQRYKTSGEKITEKAKKIENKRQEEAVEEATSRLRRKGVTRPPNEDEISSARESLDNKRKAEAARKKESAEKRRAAGQKVRNITGAVGSTVGKAWKEHGQFIASKSLGAVVGMIGMGAGGMAGAVAGAQFGHGLAVGYMSNTTNTLRHDMEKSAQCIAGLHAHEDGFDMEAKAYQVYATAQNGGYDKVEDKLDKILDKLSSLSTAQKQEFKNGVQMKLLQDPSGLNISFVQDYLKKFNVTDGSGETFNGMMNFASLAADANFAKTITNATATSSIEEVASAAAYSINNQTIINNNATQIDLDIEEVYNSDIAAGIGERRQEVVDEIIRRNAQQRPPTPPTPPTPPAQPNP